MIFDSHAHYDDEQFDCDREELLGSMQEHGIGGIINVGASMEGVFASQELADKYPFIYAGVGIHPDYVGSLNEEKFRMLTELCKKPKTVVVGEIGLDYYWDKEAHDIQKRWFIEQLKMAQEAELPVNIHSRDAAKDTLDIMRQEHAGTTGGIIHCFSSSAEMAMEYVRLGYYIGIGGVVTFKNARVMKEVAAAVPLNRIVIETDCPYLAPTPYRGKRNASLYLPLVIEEIARIKEVSPAEVEQATYENVRQLFPKIVRL